MRSALAVKLFIRKLGRRNISCYLAEYLDTKYIPVRLTGLRSGKDISTSFANCYTQSHYSRH